MKDKTLMSTCNRRFLLLLLAAFITLECAYAQPRRVRTHAPQSDRAVDAPRSQMTVHEARKSLLESLSHEKYIKSVREVRFNRHEVTFTGDTGGSYKYTMSFAGLKKTQGYGRSKVAVYTPCSIVRPNGKRYDDKALLFDFETAQNAKMFVDALLILKEAALVPDTEVVDFAAFIASSKTWLAAMPKPEMSEDARTYRLLAEDAYKRKDLTAALDFYCEALGKHPMWPEGHYNAALLAAERAESREFGLLSNEAEDYELAARHMRRYLVLAPDAKDAAAAQDKFLLWQHKAKQ